MDFTIESMGGGGYGLKFAAEVSIIEWIRNSF
jgi:hypothetical protein